MIPYKDSYALISGASRGLGSAYVEALAQRGANLVLVARSLESMEELAVELRSRHSVRVETIQADLTDVSAAGQIAKRLTQLQIRIDLLVNNAGAGLSGRFLGHTVGMGGIINISSNAAFQPLAYFATYGATKAFVLMFTEVIAEEMRNTPVRPASKGTRKALRLAVSKAPKARSALIQSPRQKIIPINQNQ